LEIADMLVPRVGRRDRHRFGRRAHAESRDRGADGRAADGLQRADDQALRKLTSNIKRTNTLVIFINQIRMKIGVMLGNPETPPGATR